MDLSALESISKALEKSLDFWGLLLLLSTAVVVFGLVVEYWHEIEEFWVIVHWPMASFPWVKFKTLVGGILVTIGVAGELLVTYKGSRVETHLRENSHKIEAFLTQQAGDAVASAKTAHEEADAAGVASREAQGTTSEVAQRAGQIDSELAQAEYLLSARRLDNTEQLAEELKKKFKGREIMLMSYRGDQEGWGLCVQLWYVAKSAEMRPVNQCGVEDFAIPSPGLENQPAVISPMQISGPNIQETVDIGGMLVRIGRLPFGAASGMPNGMLMIFVGVKPPFMIGQARSVKMPTKKKTNNHR